MATREAAASAAAPDAAVAGASAGAAAAGARPTLGGPPASEGGAVGATAVDWAGVRLGPPSAGKWPGISSPSPGRAAHAAVGPDTSSDAPGPNLAAGAAASDPAPSGGGSALETRILTGESGSTAFRMNGPTDASGPGPTAHCPVASPTPGSAAPPLLLASTPGPRSDRRAAAETDIGSSGRTAGAAGRATAISEMGEAGLEAASPLVRIDEPRSVDTLTFTPNSVTGLPGPTPADEALRGRPNVWEHPAPPLPPAARGRRRASRALTPRPIKGVRDGAPAHLQDVAELILEEWAAVPPAAIAHCWAKACILPLEMEARVLADHGDYRASNRVIADDVGEVLDLMGTCAVAQSCFGDGDRAQQELAVEGWLDLEDDPHAIEDTVDDECRVVGSGEEQP